MRGTVRQSAPWPAAIRFIPAHAGNSSPPISALSHVAVHPRACGEQLAGCGDAMLMAGSSPRMRGTELRRFLLARSWRFIPAHAGNSIVPQLPAPSRAVHPRACGEQTCDGVIHVSEFGSSPRMRGTGGRPGCPTTRSRFIPAHAGNRSHNTITPMAPSVHPRACGEQL